MTEQNEPQTRLRVEIWPREILVDLDYSDLYTESSGILSDEMDQHMWRYRYTDAGVWEPLDEGAPAYPYDRSATEHLTPGQVTVIPRSEQDEDEYGRLGRIEAALGDLETKDAREYGAVLRTRVLELAAERYPDLAIEVKVLDGYPDLDGLDDNSPEAELLETAIGTTPLPWSQIAPIEYLQAGATSRAIGDTERAAGRLPHQRISDTQKGT